MSGLSAGLQDSADVVDRYVVQDNTHASLLQLRDKALSGLQALQHQRDRLQVGLACWACTQQACGTLDRQAVKLVLLRGSWHKLFGFTGIPARCTAQKQPVFISRLRPLVSANLLEHGVQLHPGDHASAQQDPSAATLVQTTVAASACRRLCNSSAAPLSTAWPLRS